MYVELCAVCGYSAWKDGATWSTEFNRQQTHCKVAATSRRWPKCCTKGCCLVAAQYFVLWCLFSILFLPRLNLCWSCLVRRTGSSCSHNGGTLSICKVQNITWYEIAMHQIRFPSPTCNNTRLWPQTTLGEHTTFPRPPSQLGSPLCRHLLGAFGALILATQTVPPLLFIQIKHCLIQYKAGALYHVILVLKFLYTRPG